MDQYELSTLAVKMQAVSDTTLVKSATGCVPPSDYLAAKLVKLRNWESVSEDGMSREQQVIQVAEKEQQDRKEQQERETAYPCLSDAD